MSDLISRLSELRSQYSCFDVNERDAYHTLSEAIEELKEQKTSQLITNGIGVRYCSNCRRIDDKYSVANFCWFCGAKYER